MSESKYDVLKLDSQLCFPLYAAARGVVKLYRPYLSEIGLTYTQYITMMVLWEHHSISSGEMGRKLYLDSGTLTPLLKSLEKKGLVTRIRSAEDERVLIVSLTEKGEELKEKAVAIPGQVAGCVKLAPEEAAALYTTLYKLLGREDIEQKEA